MFRVKICGIANVEDALACAGAGADALGLNFYPASPRYLTLPRATAICQSLPKGVTRVGVFVNEPVESILEIADRLKLDWVQLHGDEPPERVGQLAPYRVIRALRESESGFPQSLAYLDACRSLGAMPAAVLIDAYQPDAYGGTGKTANWMSAFGFVAHVAPLPVVLAGGLRPDNVAAAIRTVRPAAVDTASGVECQPGRKDSNLTAAFVEAAFGAFAESDPRST